MQWLMDVTNVVNHKAKCERELVSWVGELSGNLLIIGGALIVAGVREHASERVQCLDDVGRCHFESVVRRLTTLTVVRDVDEVPA
jgi:hypothetical protein